jgi:diguanylate cyclase (GGDEF)-like protein
MSRRNAIAAALVAVLAYPAVPADTWAQTAWKVGIGLTAAGVVGASARRRHTPAAWYCFAVAIAVNATGSFAEAFIARVLHDDGWPTAASLFYQALYPALAAGLALHIRRGSPRADRGLLVDTATVTVALALLSWVFVLRPTLAAGSVPLLARLDGVGPAVGDLVLLSMMARVLLAGGSRTPAMRLVAAGLGLFLGGDIAWAVINQLGLEPAAPALHALDMTYLTAYCVFALASLQPATPAPVAPERRALVGRPALVLLAAVSLVGPALLALQVAQGAVTDGAAIAAGTSALFLLVIVRMAQLLRQIELQAGQLERLAGIDELTGLPNRRAWNAELPRALERARRDGGELSVAMLDLDHFKRFNDRHGHAAGDAVLKAAGAAWHGELRAVDMLARHGGEEFALLLPDAGELAAEEIVERLRMSTPERQTVSAGVATWDGAESADDLVARADRALYAAKAGGRDRVRTSPRA